MKRCPGGRGKGACGVSSGQGLGQLCGRGRGGLQQGKIKVQGVDVKRIPTWWPQFFWEVEVHLLWGEEVKPGVKKKNPWFPTWKGTLLSADVAIFLWILVLCLMDYSTGNSGSPSDAVGPQGPSGSHISRHSFVVIKCLSLWKTLFANPPASWFGYSWYLSCPSHIHGEMP